jgi:hypothetical protein
VTATAAVRLGIAAALVAAALLLVSGGFLWLTRGAEMVLTMIVQYCF